MKERYDYLHKQLNRKDEHSSLPKYDPEFIRLKSEYIAVQRKVMENEMAAKNALQNADYEIQSLKMENNLHRKKIEQLLSELTSERSSIDYTNILRSLEIS